jgi:hypothetical protein
MDWRNWVRGRSVQAIVEKASSTDTDDGPVKDEKGNAPERMWYCCSSLSG